MSRLSHPVSAVRAPLIACLCVLAAGLGAVPASAHEEARAAGRILTPTEARNQAALQAALAGNAPSAAKHASEHEAVEAAERRFAAMSPARKRALRAGIQRATVRARAANAAGSSTAATIQATATRSSLATTTALPAALAADSDAEVGAWTTAPFAAPTYAINMVMLPTGKVLVYSMGSRHADCEEGHCKGDDFGNGGVNVNNDGTAAVWDPSKGTVPSAFKILPPPNVNLSGYDLTNVKADPEVIADDDEYQLQGANKNRPAPIFCSGQVQTADGRVLVAGGNLETRGNAYGVKMVFLFDPFTEKWTREPDMLHARWYPTLTRTASGRIAILGGHDEKGHDVSSIELYPEQTAKVPGVDGAAGATGLKTTSLYDDPADPANPLGNGDEDASDAERGNNDGAGYYPFTLVLPDGRLSIDRWGSGRVGLLGEGSNPNLFHYIETTSYTAAPGEYATAFPVPGDQKGTGEMITAGGEALAPNPDGTPKAQNTVWSIKPAAADAAARAAEQADYPTAPGPAADWKAEAPLSVARRNAVATLLPDGSAVVVAGGDGHDRVPFADIQNPSGHAQNRVELWDPVTRTWKLGPAEITPRGYHSTAVLLPDGRVLSGGDDWVSYAMDTDTTDQFDSTFEIYSPPYLFRGERPSLTKVPSRVDYGKSFSVDGAGAEDHTITSASLVAPGAVTHAYDSNQRVLKLPVTVSGGSVTVTAPVSGNAAPPGDYMLFLLDDRGIPSIARFVRVGSTHAGSEVPPTTPGTTPATTPTATTPVATTPKATTPAPTTPKTTPKATTPVKSGPPPINQNPNGVVKTPAPTPEIRLTGARLSLLLAMTPTGKTCPRAVNAVASVSGVKRKVKAKLKLKPLMADGKLTCVLKGSIKLAKKPSTKARVKVTFSAKGVKRRTVKAVR